MSKQKVEKVICKACHGKVNIKRTVEYEGLGLVCIPCHNLMCYTNHAYDPIVYERGYLDEYEWDQHY